MIGILVPIFLFAVGGVIAISFSPIGKAVARRLGGKEEAAESAALAEVDALREELVAVRADLGEVQERLDFAERLLAQARERGLLGTGGA